MTRFFYSCKSQMEGILSLIIDVKKVCRLCLKEKRILMDIFESTEDSCSLNLCEKIRFCTTIRLSRDDGLPTKICVPCLSSLNAAFDFRIQCENADKSLHDMCDSLTSDQAKNDETFPVVHDNKIFKGGSKEVQGKRLTVSDNVKTIEKEGKEAAQEEESDHCCKLQKEEEEEEVEKEVESFFMLNESSEFRNDAIAKRYLSINEAGIASKDYFYGSSLQNKELNNINNQVSILAKRSYLQETSGLIPDSSKENVKINLNFLENVKGKKEICNKRKSACPICHKILGRVNEHIRLLHRNKIYICKKNDCRAEFSTLKNLQSHHLKCFNMEKQYKCLRCFKEFYRKCNYKAHIIRHSNKKNYQCQLCSKAFVDSTGLKRHFLKHHEPEQETFMSNCCNKKFKTKEGLKQHIQKNICGVDILQILTP